MSLTREQVMQALGTVFDPELGLSIVDLGLVYDVAIADGRVQITMTLTTPGCPIHDSMSEWVRHAVGAIPGLEAVEVTITFEPRWTPERIGGDLGRDSGITGSPRPRRATAPPPAPSGR